MTSYMEGPLNVFVKKSLRGKDAYFEWEDFENGYFVTVRTSKIELKRISKLKDGYFEINFENDSFEN